jgi:hypothetical protein
MGPKEKSVPEGQAAICLLKKRDKRDRIFVTEKLDGSNVGVALKDGELIALGRVGYRADSSPHEQHHMFAAWAKYNEDRFRQLLGEGERCVGEWLAQAHGTLYALSHEPFVVFDLMIGKYRVPWGEADARIRHSGFTTPFLLNDGCEPMSVADALDACEGSPHGADEVEGAVWRVERDGQFDFMAKYVRPEKVDGKLLPEMSGKPEVWNWKPATKIGDPQ